ncbi:MAG: abortive infection family protein [Moraxellaceae bacterium]|nr:abortive infection family protein [Moraxellaceae bacterium]
MSDLTNTEKRELEKLFGMSSGYVLGFTNREFDEFVIDSTGLSILEEKYNEGSGSKANRLRTFWLKEKNHIVAKLMTDLMQCISLEEKDETFTALYNKCVKIISRIYSDGLIVDMQSLIPNSPEREFSVLARAVRESIERNEPESGLDRLHTFTVKYFRTLCTKYGITSDKDKPLHSLVGEYIKSLKASGCIESEMAERILKSSISTLEYFNKVRNDQSLAHDNKMLNYEESLLIYNHVASSIKFIEAIERHRKSA